MSNDKHIPSKRIKTWHRHAGCQEPLKVFARVMSAGKDAAADTANRWLVNKMA